MEKYKKRRQADGAEIGTINRELATLSHIVTMAMEWGWLRAKPCNIRMFKEPRGRIIALDDSQIQKLMKVALADEEPDCWLFVAFGLNTAMRHSEIMRSRFDQIDFDKARLFIPEAKAGQRQQPLTPQLVEILKKEREMREDQNGWIFPSPRPNATKSGDRDRMGKPFRRAVKAAGLDPDLVTPHIMRHTAITKLVKAGVDLPTIQRISGHKTLDMVLRYTHVHGEHIDAAIIAIGLDIPGTDDEQKADTITPKLPTAKNIA